MLPAFRDLCSNKNEGVMKTTLEKLGFSRYAAEYSAYIRENGYDWHYWDKEFPLINRELSISEENNNINSMAILCHNETGRIIKIIEIKNLEKVVQGLTTLEENVSEALNKVKEWEKS